jgi:hypothetical protein
MRTVENSRMSRSTTSSSRLVYGRDRATRREPNHRGRACAAPFSVAHVFRIFIFRGAQVTYRRNGRNRKEDTV